MYITPANAWDRLKHLFLCTGGGGGVGTCINTHLCRPPPAIRGDLRYHGVEGDINMHGTTR